MKYYVTTLHTNAILSRHDSLFDACGAAIDHRNANKKNGCWDVNNFAVPRFEDGSEPTMEQYAAAALDHKL